MLGKAIHCVLLDVIQREFAPVILCHTIAYNVAMMTTVTQCIARHTVGGCIVGVRLKAGMVGLRRWLRALYDGSAPEYLRRKSLSMKSSQTRLTVRKHLSTISSYTIASA
jgi:hypothetical protein